MLRKGTNLHSRRISGPTGLLRNSKNLRTDENFGEYKAIGLHVLSDYVSKGKTGRLILGESLSILS